MVEVDPAAPKGWAQVRPSTAVLKSRLRALVTVARTGLWMGCGWKTWLSISSVTDTHREDRSSAETSEPNGCRRGVTDEHERTEVESRVEMGAADILVRLGRAVLRGEELGLGWEVLCEFEELVSGEGGR